MKDYKFKINGNDYQVSVEESDNNMLNVKVNGVDYRVEAEDVAVKRTPVARPRPKAIMQAEAPVASGSTANVDAAAGGAEKPIKTPLPGVVLDVFVKEGDAVKAGQKILLLEAMKMENNIESDKDGVVKSVRVKKGDSVQEGDILMLIA
ncbi:MAG: biotin/lipoyl-binding protein [Bacteroidales bacterium]|nr:biotin/lipoyl-binding protein [Bacteroidales bacterium]